ncbi:MAG: hypothetical protein WCO35_03950 [Candidatus Nomurabacteria bacterium]
MKIIPAILENDFEEIKKKLDFLVKMKTENHLDFDMVQIDLCDGSFVENTTWLLDEERQEERETLNEYRRYFDLEFHIMCDNQKKYFELSEKTNSKFVVVHIDKLFSGELGKQYFVDLLLESENTPSRLIFCLKLDTMFDKKDEFLGFLKEVRGYQEKIFVQVMGIENIGKQGQDFDMRSLEVIKFLRENFDHNELFIQVDGSMDVDHVKLVKDVGVDAVVVGSYLEKDLDVNVFLPHYQKLL